MRWKTRSRSLSLPARLPGSRSSFRPDVLPTAVSLARQLPPNVVACRAVGAVRVSSI